MSDLDRFHLDPDQDQGKATKSQNLNNFARYRPQKPLTLTYISQYICTRMPAKAHGLWRVQHDHHRCASTYVCVCVGVLVSVLFLGLNVLKVSISVKGAAVAVVCCMYTTYAILLFSSSSSSSFVCYYHRFFVLNFIFVGFSCVRLVELRTNQM